MAEKTRYAAKQGPIAVVLWPGDALAEREPLVGQFIDATGKAAFTLKNDVPAATEAELGLAKFLHKFADELENHVVATMEKGLSARRK